MAIFRGKTLVAHTIEQAIESDLFDHIILSSDDEAVLFVGKTYDIEIHERAADLSTDHTRIIDVIRELIKTRPISAESVIGLLLTTCPLRAVEDIIGAHKIFEHNECQSCVVSVKRHETPIQLSWTEADGFLKPVFPEEYRRSTRKQDHYDTYCYNDGVILDLARNFENPTRNLFGENPIPYVMPGERSIPIDYDFQLRIARCLGDMEAEDAEI